MEGSLHLVGEQVEPRVKTYTTMPLHDPEGSEVQMMISEYSLNSILLTAVELDILQYENNDQTSDSVESVLVGFENAFGAQPNISLVAKASTQNFTKYQPNIKISRAGSLLEFYVDLHIKNPLEPSMDAALLTAKAVTNISFFVNNNFELSGVIHELTFNVVEFLPYFKTSTTMININ